MVGKANIIMTRIVKDYQYVMSKKCSIYSNYRKSMQYDLHREEIIGVWEMALAAISEYEDIQPLAEVRYNSIRALKSIRRHYNKVAR